MARLLRSLSLIAVVAAVVGLFARRSLRHRTRRRRLVPSSSTCRASSRRFPDRRCATRGSRRPERQRIARARPGAAHCGAGVSAALESRDLRNWRRTDDGAREQGLAGGLRRRVRPRNHRAFHHVRRRTIVQFRRWRRLELHQRRNRARPPGRLVRPASPQRRPTANG